VTNGNGGAGLNPGQNNGRQKPHILDFVPDKSVTSGNSGIVGKNPTILSLTPGMITSDDNDKGLVINLYLNLSPIGQLFNPIPGFNYLPSSPYITRQGFGQQSLSRYAPNLQTRVFGNLVPGLQLSPRGWRSSNENGVQVLPHSIQNLQRGAQNEVQSLPANLDTQTQLEDDSQKFPARLDFPQILPGRLDVPQTLPGRLDVPVILPGRLDVPQILPGRFNTLESLQYPVTDTIIINETFDPNEAALFRRLQPFNAQ